MWKITVILIVAVVCVRADEEQPKTGKNSCN